MPNLTNDIKDGLIDIAKNAISSYLDLIEEQGGEAVQKGRDFAKKTEALTIALVNGDINRHEYLDALENLRMAMESAIAADAYKQARKQMKMLIEILKNVAKIVIAVVTAVL